MLLRIDFKINSLEIKMFYLILNYEKFLIIYIEIIIKFGFYFEIVKDVRSDLSNITEPKGGMNWLFNLLI